MSKKDLKFTKEENRFIDNISDILYDKEKVIEYIAEKYDDYFYMIPKGEYKQSILHKIYNNYLNRDIEDGHREVKITKAHINFLKELPSDLIKRLFYSLIVRAEVKPHSSGWISLDYENTIKYGLNEKDAKKAKIEIYSQCTPYGFDCRVSGSTKPVLCFQLPKFEESEVVFEFEDGCAAQMYEEVINYGDNNSHK
jgi:hypothetical protein